MPAPARETVQGRTVPKQGVEPFYTLQLDLGRGTTEQLKTKGKRLVLEMDAELLPPERRAELALLLRKLLKQ